MNTEQLRNMIENQRIEPYTNDVDTIEVEAKTDDVADMIARTLCVEFNNACRAEDWLDYYFKVCDYVNKQYRALMAISNRCWSSYIANVEQGVEFRTKMYIEANHEYLEADEKHRIIYMTGIDSKFHDFVSAFLTLQKTCGVNLDIEK